MKAVCKYLFSDCFMCSQWQDVLDIISKALTDNNMEFAQISRVKTFQVCQEVFTHVFGSGFNWKLKLFLTSLLVFIIV